MRRGRRTRNKEFKPETGNARIAVRRFPVSGLHSLFFVLFFLLGCRSKHGDPDDLRGVFEHSAASEEFKPEIGNARIAVRRFPASGLHSLFFVLFVLLGCRSKHGDPDDLRGVFEHSAAPLVAGAPSGSAAVKPAKSAKPRASASDDAPMAPLRRKPEPGPCLKEAGEAAAVDRHAAKRPACRRAEVLEERDPDGTPRYACVFTPDGVDKRAPLPLLLFFHGQDESPAKVSKETELRSLDDDYELGEPAHRGFVVLAPQARHLVRTAGPATVFDVGHVAQANADVKATDRFVALLERRGWVDRRRVYAMGAGQGGEMAALYAMLHADRVAAFATSAANAGKLRWTCEREPPPAAVIYRACDAVTACLDVEQWLQARDDARAPTLSIRLGSANHVEPACELNTTTCRHEKGTANHVRWPKGRERDMLEFLSRFSLDVAAGAN